MNLISCIMVHHVYGQVVCLTSCANKLETTAVQGLLACLWPLHDSGFFNASICHTHTLITPHMYTLTHHKLMVVVY